MTCKVIKNKMLATPNTKYELIYFLLNKKKRPNTKKQLLWVKARRMKRKK